MGNIRKILESVPANVPFHKYTIYDEADEFVKKFTDDQIDEMIDFIKSNEDAIFLYVSELSSQATGFGKTPKYETFLFWERDVDSFDKLEELRPVKESDLNEKIQKNGDKWEIWSKDGSKKLGTFDTEEEAKERLKAIEYFKHKNESTLRDGEYLDSLAVDGKWSVVFSQGAVPGEEDLDWSVEAFDTREEAFDFAREKIKDISDPYGYNSVSIFDPERDEIDVLTEDVEDSDVICIISGNVGSGSYNSRGVATISKVNRAAMPFIQQLKSDDRFEVKKEAYGYSVTSSLPDDNIHYVTPVLDQIISAAKYFFKDATIEEKRESNWIGSYYTYIIHGETIPEPKTPEEKIDAWHDGVRPVNIKLATLTKLNTYRAIAQDKGYEDLVDAIDKEIANRG